MIKPFNYLSVMTIFVLVSAGSTLQAAQGQDGKPGISGSGGSDGQNGTIGMNWIPLDPNPEYFFYIPIKNRDPKAFRKVLAGGAKINWPMSNIIGHPSAFEVAMESLWLEGLQIIFQNPDSKNRPDLSTQVKTRQNLEVNIYEFLTIGESLDSQREMANPRFAMRSHELEILAMVVNAETDIEWLVRATDKILPALTSEKNAFFQYPNNVEARRLIESRIAQLKKQNNSAN